jgi:hypothetical protein
MLVVNLIISTFKQTQSRGSCASISLRASIGASYSKAFLLWLHPRQTIFWLTIDCLGKLHFPSSVSGSRFRLPHQPGPPSTLDLSQSLSVPASPSCFIPFRSHLTIRICLPSSIVNRNRARLLLVASSSSCHRLKAPPSLHLRRKGVQTTTKPLEARKDRHTHP